MLSRTRDELRAIRRTLWERARLPTKEHLHVDRVDVLDAGGWRPNGDGSTAIFQIAITTAVSNGHDVTSSIEILVSRDGWRLAAEVTALNDAEVVLWRRPSLAGDSVDDLEVALLSTASQLVAETLKQDFSRSAATLE